MKAILTDDQRKFVIDNAAKYTSKELADMFKVSPQCIGGVHKYAGVKSIRVYHYKCKEMDVKNDGFQWLMPDLKEYGITGKL